METKFTYLIGAGASADALPVVTKFTNRIRSFKAEFPAKLKDLNINSDWGSYLEELLTLSNTSEDFGTIDTLAKYYYLKDKSKLFRLKKLLSVYFVLEQLIMGKLDKRYLIFLTTIMDNIQLPKKIKLLSWNYDFQFELAASTFINDIGATQSGGSITRAGTLINYVPDTGIWNRVGTANEIDLLHLNGTAGFYNDDEKKFVFSSFHHMGRGEKLLNNLSDYLNEGKQQPYFTFAWEGNSYGDVNRRSLLHEMVDKTTHLIIIGYSFPFFNRIYDNAIISGMRDFGRLEKIYYQDPELDGQFLRKQFGITKEVEIVHIKSKGNFFIPTEF